MSGVPTQLQVCPECGRRPTGRSFAKVRPRFLLWLPLIAVAIALIGLLGLSLSVVSSSAPSPPLPRQLDRSEAIVLSDTPTLGQLRRIAAGAESEQLEFDRLLRATSGLTGEHMRDEATIRVAADSWMTLWETSSTAYGWPIVLMFHFASRTVELSPGATSIPRPSSPTSFSLVGAQVGWEGANGWQSYAWVRFPTILLGANACLFAWFVARWLFHERRRLRALVVATVVVGCAILSAWPTSTHSAAPPMIGSPGNAAPTGYTVGSLREAIATPQGRQAFAARVAALVDDELVDMGPSESIFRRRTYEMKLGIDATAPAPPNAPRPPNGWPDHTGVLFVLTQPMPREGMAPGWSVWDYGGYQYGVFTKRERAKPLETSGLGLRYAGSTIGPAVQYGFNAGSRGIVWEAKLDRLATWVTTGSRGRCFFCSRGPGGSIGGFAVGCGGTSARIAGTR